MQHCGQRQTEAERGLSRVFVIPYFSNRAVSHIPVYSRFDLCEQRRPLSFAVRGQDGTIRPPPRSSGNLVRRRFSPFADAFFGLDGVLRSAPVSDILSAAISAFNIARVLSGAARSGAAGRFNRHTISVKTPRGALYRRGVFYQYFIKKTVKQLCFMWPKACFTRRRILSQQCFFTAKKPFFPGSSG